MNVLIKNKVVFFILITLFVFSCQIQINKTVSDQKTKKEKGISIVKNNTFRIRFDNIGTIHEELTSEKLYNHFIIQLEEGNIKFKESYIFLINNYGDRNDLTFTLTKVSKKEYTLEIIQETRHLTIDRLTFKKNKNNLLELIYMEQIQPGNTIQICQYNMLRKNGNKINLIIDSINDSKCYNEENK
jgi:hypothetical protein